MGCKLSILICTIPERVKSFNDIYNSLIGNDEVEILYDPRPRGVVSVGLKRQHLLEMSSGDYVVFIDDDDTVSTTYINNILNAIKSKPDSIGFDIRCILDGGKPFLARASNKYSNWMDNVDGFSCVRTPYHKTPIKREIALQIGYKDMKYGEDYDYSKRLKKSGLVKTEEFINEVMYFYNFKYKDPKIKYGL